MSMWLQTRNVRHLVNRSRIGALCGATPAMWFDAKPGHGRFVFDGPRSSAPANLDVPLCSRCRRVLAELTADAR